VRALFDNPVLLVVVLLLVVLLFGAKRLPDAARSIGRSMRIFKSEVKEMKTDDERRPASEHDGGPSRPLEGRVVDEPRREQPPTQTSYDQQQRHSA
jgi:sec-independent protein translocase protein TatA